MDGVWVGVVCFSISVNESFRIQYSSCRAAPARRLRARSSSGWQKMRRERNRSSSASHRHWPGQRPCQSPHCFGFAAADADRVLRIRASCPFAGAANLLRPPPRPLPAPPPLAFFGSGTASGTAAASGCSAALRFAGAGDLDLVPLDFSDASACFAALRFADAGDFDGGDCGKAGAAGFATAGDCGNCGKAGAANCCQRRFVGGSTAPGSFMR